MKLFIFLVPQLTNWIPVLPKQGLLIVSLLVYMYCPGVAIGKNSDIAPFTSHARVLVAAEERLRNWLGKAVDEYVARLDSGGGLLGFFDVLAEDACTETNFAVICTGNNLFFVRPRLRGDNWPEWLLHDDTGIIWRVIDDGRSDEIAFAWGNVWLACNEFIALALAIFKESLDLLILHRVLDRTEHDTFLVRAADLEILGELCHSLNKFGVDRFVDVHTLSGNADLARVEKATHGNFWYSLVHIDIRIHDAGVVATKLQSYSFQSL